MNRNSSVNNIIVTWWCDSAAFLFCVFAITMVLSLYPVTSHGEDGEQDYWYYKTNKYGFFTRYPLFLIADTDNTGSAEDIIFGFDSQEPSDAKEKMRLTDGGLLGIGTPNPAAILHLHADNPRTAGTTNASITSDMVLFTALRPYTVSSADYTEYFGAKLKLIGDRILDPLVGLRTTLGFDLRSYRITESENTIASDTEYRAISMEMSPLLSQPIKVAIGYPEGHELMEALDVNGAIRIGNTSNNSAGTIRYTDGNFQGYDGSQWLNLGIIPGVQDDIELRSGHQLIFGSTDSHRTPNNFIVNSLNVPDDDVAQFPIPETGNNYNNDDADTTGGMALVTDGLPRFTVKGNGNTYVHKRLSIGVGGHVTDTVLTVAGAVHIGPDNVQPTEFDYSDQIDDYLLWVENGIVSEDFAIANVDNWSDHVLQDDYDLKPLSEVENFIQEEGHLPGVPSAEDVKKNGYTIHEMTRTLLEKVEELTLHTIAQQKEIASLRAQLGESKSDMQAASFHVKAGF